MKRIIFIIILSFLLTSSCARSVPTIVEEKEFIGVVKILQNADRDGLTYTIFFQNNSRIKMERFFTSNPPAVKVFSVDPNYETSKVVWRRVRYHGFAKDYQNQVEFHLKSLDIFK